MTRRDDDTTILDAALFGGGALVTYFLLRGLGFGGFGLGGGGGGGGDSGGAREPASEAPAAPASPARPFCNVLIRGNTYELEGVPSDVASTVAACRAAGAAYIRASGDTRQGVLDDLIRALLESGVTWFGGPDGMLENVNRVRATLVARKP